MSEFVILDANMGKHFRRLSLLFCAFLLWGCAPGIVEAIPTVGGTSVPIPNTKVLPKPSSTVPLPTATETEAPQASATLLVLCHPGELEAYLVELSLTADQIVLLAREASQLEQLSESRATEIQAASKQLKFDLDSVNVPACLEPAHLRVIEAAIFLESGVNAILEEDFDTAREVLQESFSAISEAIANIVVMSWELTATSTPSQ